MQKDGKARILTGNFFPEERRWMSRVTYYLRLLDYGGARRGRIETSFYDKISRFFLFHNIILETLVVISFRPLEVHSLPKAGVGTPLQPWRWVWVDYSTSFRNAAWTRHIRHMHARLAVL